MIELKDRSVAAARSGCNTACGNRASVKINASIVAMSGAIMPEPLAKPLRRTSTPPNRAVAAAPLGKVSVVMIARAAFSQFVGPSSGAAFPSPAVSFSAGKVSPMTPVEAMKISFALPPTSRAAAAAVASTAAFPALPVKTLALPELTTSPRTRPDLRQSRHHRTGAPGVSERVKRPATVEPDDSSASIRSSRPS